MNELEVIRYLEKHYTIDLELGEIRKYLMPTRSGGLTTAGRGTIAGYTNSSGYRVLQIRGKNHYIHRLIWLYAIRSWPKGEIDHINRVRSDNRLSNLRDVTASQNGRNKTPDPGEVRGVGIDRRHKRFKAYIDLDGKRCNLGTFKTYGAACRARVKAEVEMAGVHWDEAA